MRPIQWAHFLLLLAMGCKTTSNVNDSASHTKNIQTGYYTLKTSYNMDSKLAAALQAATGQAMCAGEFYSDDNKPTVGVYICAHGPNDIKSGTGLLFDSSNTYFMQKNGYTIGAMSKGTDNRIVVNSMCTGQFEKICRISYNPEGNGLEFVMTVDPSPTKWTFKVANPIDLSRKLENKFSNIDGHKVCFAMLTHDAGYNYGIHLCDPSTDPKQDPKQKTYTYNDVALVWFMGTKSATGTQKFGLGGQAWGEAWSPSPIGTAKMTIHSFCNDPEKYRCEVHVRNGRLVIDTIN